MTQKLPLKLHGTDTNPAQVQRVSSDLDKLIICESMRVHKATHPTEWSPKRIVPGCYRWRDMQGPGWTYGLIDAKGNIEPIESEAAAFARVRAR